MKARIFLILIFFIGLTNGSLAQKVDEKQKQFADKFIAAVDAHSYNGVFKLLDKAYRKEQLKFLEGNKEQLVNELFGGSEMNSDVYVNVKLNDIQSISVEQVVTLKGGQGYTYLFRIQTKEKEILGSILLKKRGKKYGFVGSVG